MTTAHMPGRQGTTRATMKRNLMDAYAWQEAEEAAMLADQVEDDHNLPAIVWWVVVSVCSVIAFGFGLSVGAGS